MGEQCSGTAYLVCQVDWEYNDEGGYGPRGEEARLAFRDRDRAEAHRLELERQSRKAWHDPNPARFTLDYDSCGDETYLSCSTSLDEETLAGRLAERGVPLPPPNSPGHRPRYNWLSGDWWEEAQRQVPQADWPWLWDLFDRVRFYEVVEVPLDSLGDTAG